MRLRKDGRLRLRKYMTRRGMSVRALAAECGLRDHGLIQQLRSGKRRGCTETVAVAIAARLGVETGDLFDLTSSSNALRNDVRDSADGGTRKA